MVPYYHVQVSSDKSRYKCCPKADIREPKYLRPLAHQNGGAKWKKQNPSAFGRRWAISREGHNFGTRNSKMLLVLEGGYSFRNWA